jgi:hypothetical protein
MGHATRYESGTPVNRRPLLALYTTLVVLLAFAGLLAAIVVVVGLGEAIDWTGPYPPVAVLLSVFIRTFVLFVRMGGKVYAKYYEELYKRL